MELELGAGGNRRSRPFRSAGGYSLVEVLMGLVILMVTLVALIPLFTRSIQQNLEGKQSTEATGHGRTELENLLQLDFNNWLVNIEAGTERSEHLYWTEGDPDQYGDEYWTDVDPSPLVADWEMDSVVQQFGITDVRDDDLDGIFEVIVGLEDDDLDGVLDNPLPAGSLPAFIHVKSLDVVLQKEARALVMGDPMRFEILTMKAF